MVQVGWKFKVCLLAAAAVAEWAKRNGYIEFGGREVYSFRQPVQDILTLVPDNWVELVINYIYQMMAALSYLFRHGV